MLKIVVPKQEDWDPVQEKFISVPETRLLLEHSLISISKWETKYHKPFLSDNNRTEKEMRDYIKFMTVNKIDEKIEDLVYTHLTPENLIDIRNYMDDPMTATTFSDRENKQMSKKKITSELVYYWMTAYNIPFECQKWPFNRLITLIKVASIENQPSKKMSKSDIRAQNRSLNAARRARHHSKG